MCDDDKPADMQILNIMQELFVSVRVGGRETSVVRGEEKLPNLFVYSHFAQCGLNPGASGRRHTLRRTFGAGTGLWCGRGFLVLGGGFAGGLFGPYGAA